MHTHCDMPTVGDTYGRHIMRAAPDDVFIGSAPIAFGLGAVVLFPLRIGASTILLEQASPDHLRDLTRAGRPTVRFTAPTADRALLPMLHPGDTAAPLRLRRGASPKATWEAWHAATGIPILAGIGSIGMLHIFIDSPRSDDMIVSSGYNIASPRSKRR